jgi:hypothetical protein
MDEPMYRYDEYQRWHPENDSYNQHSYHDQRQQYGQDWSDGITLLKRLFNVYFVHSINLYLFLPKDGMDVVESRLSRKVREYGERLAWLDKDFEEAKEE